MRRIIQIGERQVEMLGNAATALHYKQTFHEDLLKSVASLSGKDETEMLAAIERIQSTGARAYQTRGRLGPE